MKRFPCLLSQTLVMPNDKFPLLHLPGVCGSCNDITFHQCPEDGDVDEFEKNEVLSILLQTNQNVALDITQIQRHRFHQFPRSCATATSTSSRSRRSSTASRTGKCTPPASQAPVVLATSLGPRTPSVPVIPLVTAAQFSRVQNP